MKKALQGRNILYVNTHVRNEILSTWQNFKTSLDKLSNYDKILIIGQDYSSNSKRDHFRVNL